jgi:hypothetical protein
MEHGDVFFWYAPGPDLACKIWACIVKYRNNITIKTYHISLVPPDPVPVLGRGGQALYIFGVCPVNRDELQPELDNTIPLRFIPIFWALHSQLHKGHTKKRHPHVPHMHHFSV